MRTHEQFIQDVANIVSARVDAEDREKLAAIKLVYGAGAPGVRGVTYYNVWNKTGCKHTPAFQPFVEICAFSQSEWIQIACTTIHELGHVLAGHEAGHKKAWKEACKRLGLRRAVAAGQQYLLADLAPDVRMAVAALEKPTEGAPRNFSEILGRKIKPKPCNAGIGSRGGKSRGQGSGSRLLKVVCGECGYTARVTRKWLDVGAPHCPEHGEMIEA